ncbi:MAG: DsrE family protein [Pseudomonadota bacterium]|nr:MAG: DsrE family protein [Pseudomonadota bacterium]
MKSPSLLFFCFACLLLPLAHASTSPIAHLLERSEAPPGVVFEIVSGDDDALHWAIPAVQDYIRQLRARFPGLSMAVVTHGREQFGLEKNHQQDNAKVHKATRSLVQDQDVPVHVCGTHASWRGVSEEDFPDYVDVVPQGPTQIQLYEELGYELVVLSDPTD